MVVEIKVAEELQCKFVPILRLDKLCKRVRLKVLIDARRRALELQGHALVAELSPDSLDVSREDKAELLVDVEVAVVHPEVVPTVLSQVRLARAQDHVRRVVVGKHNSPARHVVLHQVDQVVMDLALDFVQYRDASRPTVHAEGPPDLLRKLSSEVPTPAPNLRLIDLDWPAQLDKRQHACVHIVMARFTEEEELLLQSVASTAHVAGHFRSGSPDPHREGEVEQQGVYRVYWSRLCDSLDIVADGANPNVADVLALRPHEPHP